VPIYCEHETEQTIRRVFSYAFRSGTERLPAGFVPQLNFVTIEPGMAFEVLGQQVLPIRLEHGPFPVLGFRVGSLAYCTDVSRVPDASLPLLEGLDVLVLDALRHEPHPTHLSLSEALSLIESLKPGQTYLTHLSHGFDHGPTQAILPPGVALAYDGLQVPF
jgi:phosphoribosyl 1,2-cyclic phosphate phosphodiesterase